MCSCPDKNVLNTCLYVHVHGINNEFSLVRIQTTGNDVQVSECHSARLHVECSRAIPINVYN